MQHPKALKICQLDSDLITRFAKNLYENGRISDSDSIGLSSGAVEQFDEDDIDALYAHGYIGTEGECLKRSVTRIPGGNSFEYAIVQVPCEG